MTFEFAAPQLVVFGPGSLERLGEQAARFGRRAWLVAGSRTLERDGVLDRAHERLRAAGVAAESQAVSGEPDTTTVDRGARDARAAGCDVVVAIGGGSALDSGKAIAALMANGGEAIDYLEVVGRGRRIEKPSVPFIAVPTTAGTGSEATRNAVIADPATGTKASIRHEHLLPRVALLDPTLTHSVPPAVTASTGIDALIQLIEPYVSRRANPIIDALALAGIRRAAPALPRAFADGGNAAARADLMLAAWWSGLALAHAGLGAAHGFSGPLGGTYPIVHGMACAATMPYVMAANLDAAECDASGGDTIRRYADVARAMGEPSGGRDLDVARAGVARMEALCRALRVPRLREVGVTRDAIPDLVARAKRTSSMKANPVDLGDRELERILEQAIG